MREYRNSRFFTALAWAAICWAALCVVPCRAQNSTPAGNAKVKQDSLTVYSEMDSSSSVMRTLKKGDELVMDFQVASATGNWCGIRLPAQTARLGYVPCDGLEISTPRPVPEPGPSAASRNPEESAIHLTLDSPAARPTNAYDQVASLVVKEGEIDVVKMQELDTTARNGSAAAMDRAALAHLAAGNFELSRNDNNQAIDQFRSGLDLASKNREILFATLLDLSYVHLLRSEYSAAIEFLDRARPLAPNSAIVAQFSGWADYGLNRLDDAVTQWQQAQRLEPNPQVAQLLEKAQRDRTAEGAFHQEGETSHFVLRYQGGAAPELAEAILQTLQADFADIQSLLHFTPPGPIGVVLYTGETFRDITRAPSWAGALNDGRIRVPVQGLNSVSPELARVLKHELTHSFVRQMTENRCPTWLNEGLAQWVEGRRSGDDAKALVDLYEQKKYIPLDRLEGPWMGFPALAARFAYAWSLAAVESIIANSGMWGIQRLFAGLGEQGSVRTALGPALQTNYEDLELQTVQYLRQTYLQ